MATLSHLFICLAFTFLTWFNYSTKHQTSFSFFRTIFLQYFLSIFKIDLFYRCKIFSRGGGHICAHECSTCGGQKGEVQAVVSCSISVLKTKLQSSAGTASALNLSHLSSSSSTLVSIQINGFIMVFSSTIFKNIFAYSLTLHVCLLVHFALWHTNRKISTMPEGSDYQFGGVKL